jgi:hypothetical protein
MRDLVAANPGPAVHMAVLGIAAVIAGAIYGVVRWRHKRDAAEAEMHNRAVEASRPEDT